MTGLDHGPAAEPGRTVFVEVTALSDRHLTGIGRYTARLALALKAAPGARARFFTQDTEVLPPPGLDSAQDQDLADWSKRVWRGRRAAIDFDALPADTLAVYPCLRPLRRLFPFEVSVLHDFTPALLPWTHAAGTNASFLHFYAQTLLDADAAVAVSHSTRADAAWLTDLDPRRVVTAHSGPSQCVHRHLDAAPVTRRPEVGLVVSTVEPRKNAPFLLDWFRSTEVLPEGAELWWVGPVGWLTSRRALRAYEKARGRKVRFLGVVSDAALCRLYRTAGWTAYPSLYEGFGFPVLDALRHGAPVLSSYHSSLRELDHPGVHYFDPYDPATVDDAWRGLQAAGGAASLGPVSALDARFNWESVARAVLSLGRPAAPPAAARAA